MAIIVTAVPRLFDPRPIEGLGLGLGISLVASAVNFVVARILIRAGQRYGSIALEADAHHLMTDVWTSIGVIAGVAAAALTGWHLLDPILALAVAANIIRIGYSLLRRSALGLLDTAIPAEMQLRVREVLDGYREQGIDFHALRTRRAGARRFVSFHVLVPGEWSVQHGHDLLEEIEGRVREVVPNSAVFTHLEPVEDPVSWEDTRLERGGSGESGPT